MCRSAVQPSTTTTSDPACSGCGDLCSGSVDGRWLCLMGQSSRPGAPAPSGGGGARVSLIMPPRGLGCRRCRCQMRGFRFPAGRVAWAEPPMNKMRRARRGGHWAATMRVVPDLLSPPERPPEMRRRRPANTQTCMRGRDSTAPARWINVETRRDSSTGHLPAAVVPATTSNAHASAYKILFRQKALTCL